MNIGMILHSFGERLLARTLMIDCDVGSPLWFQRTHIPLFTSCLWFGPLPHALERCESSLVWLCPPPLQLPQALLTILNCLPANIAADTLDRRKFSFNQNSKSPHSHLLLLLGAASCLAEHRLISRRSLKLAPNQEAFCAS